MLDRLLHSGLMPRATAALLYAAVAFGLAFALAKEPVSRTGAAPGPPASSLDPASVTLEVHSSHPLASIEVQVEGKVVELTSAGPREWRVTVPSTERTLIAAQAEDPLEEFALRVRASGGSVSWERTVWGSGESALSFHPASPPAP
jgi:hypothetical protein